jgi:hypothetical protein
VNGSPEDSRPIETFVLPLSPGVVAELELPRPLRAPEWDQMQRVLAAMRPGLVGET